MRYHWYHGNMNKDKAERVLSEEDRNTFLVRHSSSDLFLSSKRREMVHHHLINYNTEGYHLEEKEIIFKTLPEMITHYMSSPVDSDSDEVLGIGCHRPGTYMHECAIKYHFINEYYVVKDGEETSHTETHILEYIHLESLLTSQSTASIMAT